jgi:nicotinic acid mononucleotide adenylyltransferase
MKIAIYWWAFNPPTLWHLHVIEQIFKNSDIKKIIITPDWERWDKNYNISNLHRGNLIDLFIDDLKNKWLNIELDKYFLNWANKSNTTTYEVDKYFIKKIWTQPFHIFWTDIVEWISDWDWNPNMYIQKKLKKIFIPRKWYSFNNSELKNYILIETNYLSDISSTTARIRIKEWINLNQILERNILNYIHKNKLYT